MSLKYCKTLGSRSDMPAFGFYIFLVRLDITYIFSEISFFIYELKRTLPFVCKNKKKCKNVCMENWTLPSGFRWNLSTCTDVALFPQGSVNHYRVVPLFMFITLHWERPPPSNFIFCQHLLLWCSWLWQDVFLDA